MKNYHPNNVMILASFVVLAFSLHDSMVLAHHRAALEDENVDVSNNPFRCTVSANDKQYCVLLERCVWCQGEGLPGICVSEKQEKALIHKIPHVKCFRDDDDDEHHFYDDEKAAFLRGRQEANDGAPFDSQCLNAPSNGSLLDDDQDGDPRKICDATTDSQGEMCSWCDAAGVFQLCLSNEQAKLASLYLQCDLAEEAKMTDVTVY